MQPLILLRRLPILQPTQLGPILLQPCMREVDEVDEVRVGPHAEEDKVVEREQVALAAGGDVRDVDEVLLQSLDATVHFVDEGVELPDLGKSGGNTGSWSCARVPKVSVGASFPWAEGLYK